MFYSEPKILGVSMTSRRNRRRLVVITYTWLAAMIIAVVFNPSNYVLSNPGYLFILIFSGVSVGTFGAIVRQFTFPVRRNVVDPGLELDGHNPAMDLDPEPDERDTKIRDHAYFIAFRVIAVGMLLAWIGLAIVTQTDFSLHSRIAVARSVNGFLMPFVVLALTLPQAIILWQQPDMITD